MPAPSSFDPDTTQQLVMGMVKSIDKLDEIRVAFATYNADQNCTEPLGLRNADMWRWQTGLAPNRDYSRSFRNRESRRYRRIKPQPSWCLGLFTPLERPPVMPFGVSARHGK